MKKDDFDDLIQLMETVKNEDLATSFIKDKRELQGCGKYGVPSLFASDIRYLNNEVRNKLELMQTAYMNTTSDYESHVNFVNEYASCKDTMEPELFEKLYGQYKDSYDFAKYENFDKEEFEKDSEQKLRNIFEDAYSLRELKYGSDYTIHGGRDIPLLDSETNRMLNDCGYKDFTDEKFDNLLNSVRDRGTKTDDDKKHSVFEHVKGIAPDVSRYAVDNPTVKQSHIESSKELMEEHTKKIQESRNRLIPKNVQKNTVIRPVAKPTLPHVDYSYDEELPYPMPGPMAGL